MRTECIHLTTSWQKQGPQHDCALVVKDQDKLRIQGMSVVRIKLFFLFTHDMKTYTGAFVEWFKCVDARPDPKTGMGKIRPDTYRNGQHITTVLHLDTFLHGVHILPVFGRDLLPSDFHFLYSLDAFETYYISKYADHHAHEICS